MHFANNFSFKLLLLFAEIWQEDCLVNEDIHLMHWVLSIIVLQILSMLDLKIYIACLN